VFGLLGGSAVWVLSADEDAVFGRETAGFDGSEAEFDEGFFVEGERVEIDVPLDELGELPQLFFGDSFGVEVVA